jgi:chromosome segregation ATPase
VEALCQRINEKPIKPEINQMVMAFEKPKIIVERKQTWINYYSRDYWRRKSDNLENITKIAKMLSHMRENNITEIKDYDVLLKVARADVREIKNKADKLENEYDQLEKIYLTATVEEQSELTKQMTSIRAEIRPLNYELTDAVNKRNDLEEFQKMFEREQSKSQNQKHEKGRSK